jgi:hypothetical protein
MSNIEYHGPLCQRQQRLQTGRSIPRRHDLDRDVAAPACVVGAIDFAHPARANGGDDLVDAEACSRT